MDEKISNLALEDKASSILKSFLNKNDMDYQELSNLLQKIGVNESNANLSNKINRGKFSFAFVIQILEAMNKNLLIFLNNEPTITKEQFVDSYLEINKLLRETDNDEIYETLDKAETLLYKKAGFTNDIINYIGAIDMADIHFSEITKETVEKFYDEMMAYNKVSISANNLYSKIANL